MVAYNFKARFVPAIESGLKTHTIRKERVGRSRHAGEGDTLQLQTGSRFKPRRIGTATCYLAASPITLRLFPWRSGGRVTIMAPPEKFRLRVALHKAQIGIVMEGQGPLDFFARSDGFTGWDDMLEFWDQEHSVRGVDWSGTLICWKDFQRCA